MQLWFLQMSWKRQFDQFGSHFCLTFVNFGEARYTFNLLCQLLPCIKIRKIQSAYNMQEYGFSMSRIFPYKDTIQDFFLTRENTSVKIRILPYSKKC